MRSLQAAEEAGEPLLRPTLYDFDADAGAWAPSDELMLGPSLLAAPVVQPGQRQRTVSGAEESALKRYPGLHVLVT